MRIELTGEEKPISTATIERYSYQVTVTLSDDGRFPVMEGEPVKHAPENKAPLAYLCARGAFPVRRLCTRHDGKLPSRLAPNKETYWSSGKAGAIPVRSYSARISSRRW